MNLEENPFGILSPRLLIRPEVHEIYTGRIPVDAVNVVKYDDVNSIFYSDNTASFSSLSFGEVRWPTTLKSSTNPNPEITDEEGDELWVHFEESQTFYLPMGASSQFQANWTDPNVILRNYDYDLSVTSGVTSAYNVTYAGGMISPLYSYIDWTPASLTWNNKPKTEYRPRVISPGGDPVYPGQSFAPTKEKIVYWQYSVEPPFSLKRLTLTSSSPSGSSSDFSIQLPWINYGMSTTPAVTYLGPVIVMTGLNTVASSSVMTMTSTFLSYHPSFDSNTGVGVGSYMMVLDPVSKVSYISQVSAQSGTSITLDPPLPVSISGTFYFTLFMKVYGLVFKNMSLSQNTIDDYVHYYIFNPGYIDGSWTFDTLEVYHDSYRGRIPVA
jgi:hypothetical protein